MKKAHRIYNDIVKKVAEFESAAETRIYNKIGTMVNRANSARLDIRIEKDLKLADEKLSDPDLKTEIKEEIQRYKEVLKQESDKQTEFVKKFSEFNEELH